MHAAYLWVCVCLMGNEHISIVITEQLISPLQLEVSWIISAAVLNTVQNLTWLWLLFSPDSCIYVCVSKADI